MNKENSIEAQKKILEASKLMKRKKKREKMQKLKDEWKKRENIT